MSDLGWRVQIATTYDPERVTISAERGHEKIEITHSEDGADNAYLAAIRLAMAVGTDVEE